MQILFKRALGPCNPIQRMTYRSSGLTITKVSMVALSCFSVIGFVSAHENTAEGSFFKEIIEIMGKSLATGLSEEGFAWKLIFSGQSF